MSVHAWERRQAEREAQAAVGAVARLERALVENAEEMECRLAQLAEIRAAVEANRARMAAANEAGVRVVFDGSRREAEPLWERVPTAAVAMMEAAIADGERLAEEESRLLAAVTNCERQRDQIIRTLERWRPIVAGLRDTLAATGGPEPVAASTDFPTGGAPVGTAEDEAAERAEAAAAVGSGAHSTLPVQPAASSSASIRDRLASLGERIGRWQG
jgi:hypothetical protein